MKARAQCGTGRTVDGDAEPIPQLLQALSVRRHLGGWLILAFRTSSRLFGALPCLLFACAAPSIALLATAQTSADGPRILPHVTIAGLDVGGLTASEAVEVLSTQVADELSREITLRAPDHEFAITLRDLGGRADLEDAVARALDVGRGQTVPTALREAVDTILGSFEVDLPIILEPARARTITEGLLSDVRREPRDARATVANGELVIEPHIVGVEPDVQATTEALIEAAHRGDPEVTISVREILPEVLTSSLEDLVLLASFTTHFSTGQVNRATNIRIGSALIDGAVVPRRGHLLGEPDHRASDLRQGLPRRARLQRPERHIRHRWWCMPDLNHHLQCGIGGGPQGRDGTNTPAGPLRSPGARFATIDYGSADFRFQNTTGGPIIVRTTIDGDYLTCALLGRKSSATSGPRRRLLARSAGQPAAGWAGGDGGALTRGAPRYRACCGIVGRSRRGGQQLRCCAACPMLVRTASASGLRLPGGRHASHETVLGSIVAALALLVTTASPTWASEDLLRAARPLPLPPRQPGRELCALPSRRGGRSAERLRQGRPIRRF